MFLVYLVVCTKYTKFVPGLAMKSLEMDVANIRSDLISNDTGRDSGFKSNVELIRMITRKQEVSTRGDSERRRTKTKTTKAAGLYQRLRHGWILQHYQ